MKLTQAPCKITGIQLGEASINLIVQGMPSLKAKFAYLADDQGVAGYVEKFHGWSDKTLVAMQQFAEALEEEMLKLMFKVSDSEVAQQDQEDTNEPPQF